MNKFLRVAIGIYFALWGVILGILALLILILPPAAQKAEIPQGISIMYLGLGGMLLAVGIGLMARKRWARFAVIILSCFTALCGVFGVLALFLTPPPPNAAELPAQVRLISAVIVGFITIVLPAGFVYFLTRPPVTASFGAGAPAKPGSLPLTLKCIAGFYFFGIVSGLGMTLFMKDFILSINFGNYILTPAASSMYLLLLNGILFVLLIGLLKRQMWGWRGFLAFSAYTLLQSLYNLTTKEETLRVLYSRMKHLQETEPAMGMFYVSLIFGIIVQGLVINYVYKKKYIYMTPQAPAGPVT